MYEWKLPIDQLDNAARAKDSAGTFRAARCGIMLKPGTRRKASTDYFVAIYNASCERAER
jgi:hypothetical protein